VALDGAKTALGRARLWHVRTFQHFLDTERRGFKRSQFLYCAAVNDGAAGAPGWVSEAIPRRLLEPTLEKWVLKHRRGGAAALDPQHKGNPNGHFAKNRDQWDFALGLQAAKPHMRAARVHEAVAARFGAAAAPSLRTVQRAIAGYKESHAAEALLLSNPDKYRSKYQVALGSRSENIVRLNQVWEVDSTSLEVLLKGETRRRAILAVVDVYSGRSLFELAETSNGAAIGRLLLRAVREWGLPEIVKTDNGKDYTGAALERFLADLGIEHTLCAPYSPEQKPYVEREIGKFLHDLVELIPGYLGHNVAEAQAIRSFRAFGLGQAPETGITAEQFVEFMDAWAAKEHHRRRGEHGRLGGRSPAEMVNEWSAGNEVRRVAELDSLGFLLSVPVKRTLQKKGIRFKNLWYIAPEMGVSIGEKVEVRESPEAPGRLAVFDGRGEFAYIAVCPELVDVDRSEIAARSLARQKAANAAIREAARELKRQAKPKGVFDAILESRQSSNIAVFQRPDYTDAPEGLAAGAADRLAAKAQRQRAAELETAPRLTPEEKAGSDLQWERTGAEARQREQNREPIDTRYIRIWHEMARGAALDAADAEFYERFKDTDLARSLTEFLTSGAAM
jgi:transposase InsO family protein